ncbi:hypothetical protein NLI96_g8596 [Meripilus lineatus]|uniref:Microbial-type PARG catalytic domain-containing protein n=1 Tax=Meripilus lineatus TaxID=2056292 RepID=A0AAD5UX37_9APHY|nr:hypothetical protein NLI96_g8596 [Physisporinus lineatus]
MKDGKGKWVDQDLEDSEGSGRRALEVDVVTSPALNAGVVRKSTKVTAEAIESTMRERMARILYLFEKQGIRHIVLGSFGTGAFRNDVDMVAKLWKELLCDAEARYSASFENVVFAVLGRETFLKFVEIFGANGSGETQHPG